MIDPIYHNTGELRELRIAGVVYTPQQLERILGAARAWRDAVEASRVSGPIALTHTLTVAALTAEHALLTAIGDTEEADGLHR